MLQLTKYFPDQKTDSKIRITILDISNCKKKRWRDFHAFCSFIKKKDKKHFFARLSF